MKSFSSFRAISARLHESMKTTEVTVEEDEILEDAPTNNAGGGNIAGLGVGPNGEPGVPLKRKRAILVGPEPSDPRMFRAKIFKRKLPA